MKRFFVICFCLILIISSCFAEIDLSGMSFDDLVALREQLNLALWNSQSWQKVEVPPGTYEIGKDIPAGHWTIVPYYDSMSNVFYFNLVDKYGKNPAVGWEGWNTIIADASKYSDWEKYAHQCDAVLADGMYLQVTGRVYFTPYVGPVDFGFQ